MGTVTTFPAKTCCECGKLAKVTLELVDEDGRRVDKSYCSEHFQAPLSDDSLRSLLDKRDAEIERLRAVLEPFSEFCRRLGYEKLPEDDPRLSDHIVEAPADDIAPGAVYCLMGCTFSDAVKAFDNEQNVETTK